MEAVWNASSRDLAGLGISSKDSVVKVTIAGVIDGSLAKQLKAIQLEQMRLNAKLAAQKLKIDMMPTGPDKERARVLWEQADKLNREVDSDRRKAIGKYNQIARLVRTVPLGPKPPLLSGMGFAVTASTIVAAVAVMAGVSALAYSLSLLLDSMNGKVSKQRSLIDQVSALVHESSGFVSTTAWAVIGIVGSYIALTLFRDFRRASGKKSATKIIPGKVLA